LLQLTRVMLSLLKLCVLKTCFARQMRLYLHNALPKGICLIYGSHNAQTLQLSEFLAATQKNGYRSIDILQPKPLPAKALILHVMDRSTHNTT